MGRHIRDDRQMKALTAYPTPNATTCCPSSNTSPRPRSRKRMKKGSCPERARAHRAGLQRQMANDGG